MLIAIIFWSGAFIAGKFAIAEFSPFTLTFFRFFLAFLFIFPVLIIKEKNWKISKQDIPKFLVLGSTGMFGYHLFFFLALKYTSVINSSLIGTLNPIITTLLAITFLKDRVSLKKALAIFICFFGVLLTITNGNFAYILKNKISIGDLYMIIAVISWSIYSIYSKTISLHFSPLKITTYSFLFCIFLIFPFTLWEHSWSYLHLTTTKGWGSIIYMALFPSVIGFSIQQMAIQKIGPRKTATLGYLVPVISILLSTTILHEKLIPIKILSSILIITSLYFATQN